MENKGFEIDVNEAHNRNAGFNNIKRGFFLLGHDARKTFYECANQH